MRRGLGCVGATVLAVACGGCAVVHPSAGGTATPHPSVSASSSGQATPSMAAKLPAGVSLGPGGVGALKLGMTKAEAVATGLATGITGQAGTCGAAADGRLAGAMPADNDDLDGKLFFSATTGKLVAIGATAAVATPEGVHLGSVPSEVKKAYPSWPADADDQLSARVRVPTNPGAEYALVVDGGQVLELVLQSREQDCF